jgi:hypothetical protein
VKSVVCFLHWAYCLPINAIVCGQPAGRRYLMFRQRIGRKRGCHLHQRLPVTFRIIGKSAIIIAVSGQLSAIGYRLTDKHYTTTPSMGTRGNSLELIGIYPTSSHSSPEFPRVPMRPIQAILLTTLFSRECYNPNGTTPSKKNRQLGTGDSS